MVKCQCRNPKDCRRIVTYWCQPDPNKPHAKHRDGRRAGYIELPHNRRIEKTVLHEFENQRRQRFFQYLTGGTSATDIKTQKQTRDYVALHHFPVEVLNADGSGLTQETVNAVEALELGLTQQDRVTVQGYLSGVSFEGQYIVVPNYPWKNLVEEYLALGGSAKELQGNLPDSYTSTNSLVGATPVRTLPTTSTTTTTTSLGESQSETTSTKDNTASESGDAAAPATATDSGSTSNGLARPLATAALQTNGSRGYDRVTLLEARLEYKDARIQEQDARIAEQDKRIQEQDARIAEQDKRIQELESWTGISALPAPTTTTATSQSSSQATPGLTLTHNHHNNNTTASAPSPSTAVAAAAAVAAGSTATTTTAATEAAAAAAAAASVLATTTAAATTTSSTHKKRKK